jgi:hypothetical protein
MLKSTGRDVPFGSHYASFVSQEFSFFLSTDIQREKSEKSTHFVAHDKIEQNN